ncbi:MAG: FHA domain-containing protein [Planctomycetota bacterium]
MAKLEILSGKGAGTVVELEQYSGKITLGNRRTATIQVRDPWISFVHAELEEGGGGWTIVDKRSKAGTFVNGEKVGVRSQSLNDGDTIALGKTEILFSADGAAKPAKGGKAKAASGAPAAAAPAAPSKPAGIGGMDPLPAGPFTPVAAPAAGDAPQLAADLQRARAEADGLRQALVARERALAEAQSRLAATEGADPEALRVAEHRAQAAEALAQQATAALEDTKAKARIRLEELQRLNQALEARVAGGGGADAVQLERQLAAGREELRRLQDEARRRFEQLQQEKAALEAQLAGGGGADPAELAEARAQVAAAEERAAQAEGKLDALEDEVGTVQSQKRELDLELEDLRQQLASASKAQAHGGEEVAALEKAIADLNEDLAAARAERREALQALQDKDTALADLRGKATTGRIDPAQISGLRRQLSELEDKLGQREKELEQARNEAEVAKTALEAAGLETAGGGGGASEAELQQLRQQLATAEAARQAAEQRASAAEAAAATAAAAAATAAAAASAAPAAEAGGGADAEQLAALQARVGELEGENAALLRDLEEINEDMLAQEEEYQERIQELEARLGEA